jgi:mRNA interferase MazF
LKDYLKDYPKRGEIWLVSLESVAGHEIDKTRPALVISNDRNNEFSSTVTVIPITSSSMEKVYPFEVLILKTESGLASDSKIKCNQIRTLDKSRLLKLSGVLSLDKMVEVESALMIHLDISGNISERIF